MSNVPKLRFKEFSGEWEEKKLEQLFLIRVQALYYKVNMNYNEKENGYEVFY